MRTNRRTDMTKLIVAFRNFAKAPKNQADLGVLSSAKEVHIPRNRNLTHVVPTIDCSLEFANILNDRPL